MNPPFALSAIGGAVLQLMGDRRALVLKYEAGFDAFARLMEQLPPFHAVGALLLRQRYGITDPSLKDFCYA